VLLKEGVERLKTIVFNEKEISPEDTLYFFGFTAKGPLEDFERIKKFVLSLPKVKMIYQHRDVQYLIIIRAEVPQP
jgi:hypothetical protein